MKPADDERAPPWHPMPEWVKTTASIILAAVSAYWAIRLDLAITIKDVAFLQATVVRHEAAIDKLRESAALKAAQSQSEAR